MRARLKVALGASAVVLAAVSCRDARLTVEPIEGAADAVVDTAPDSTRVAPPDRCAVDAACGHPALFDESSHVTLDFISTPPLRVEGGDCWESDVHAELDFAGTLHLESCVNGATRPRDVTVDETSLVDLRARLNAFCEMPMPSCCRADGQQFTLTLAGEGGSAVYLFDDYDCRHRQDTRYATGDILGFLRKLRSLAPLPVDAGDQ